MISPSTAKTGDMLKWRDNAGNVIDVRVISVDGSTAMVRLADGSWRQCPLEALSPTDITAGSPVRSSQVGEKVTGADFSKRALLEGFRKDHPAVGGIVDNYGVVHHREPIGPGTTLIKASTGRPVVVQASATERGLFVCKLENETLEVLTSDEVLMGDKQPLAKTTDATLQKRASGFRDGQRVRLTRAFRGVEAGAVGTVHGDTGKAEAYIRFATNSGESYALIKAELLEII